MGHETRFLVEGCICCKRLQMLKERGKEILNRKLGSKLLAPLTDKTTQGFGEPYDSQALGTGSCELLVLL